MDGRIYYLRNRLINNLDHEWNIEEMAEIVELSVPHFQKLFKIYTGKSPIAYLRELRLEKACKLLEDSFHQIKQIGNKVGMRNESHFTRDFKKKFGLAPSEYRKRHWKNNQAGSEMETNNSIRQELYRNRQ